MPIVNRVVEGAYDGTQAMHIVVRFYDQEGREYMQSFWLAAGLDLTALLNSRAAEMSVQLAEQEFEAMVGAA